MYDPVTFLDRTLVRRCLSTNIFNKRGIITHHFSHDSTSAGCFVGIVLDYCCFIIHWCLQVRFTCSLIGRHATYGSIYLLAIHIFWHRFRKILHAYGSNYVAEICERAMRADIFTYYMLNYRTSAIDFLGLYDVVVVSSHYIQFVSWYPVL